MVSERLAPHDPAAESAVVAAVMVADDAIAACAPHVQPGDFFREANGLIYAAELALWQRREAINQITVAHELHQRGQLEPIGGSAYLGQLTSDLPTAVAIEYSARIVARDALYRRLMSAGQAIANDAWRGGPEAEIVLSNAYRHLQDASGSALGSEWQTAAELADLYGEELLRELTDPQTREVVPTGLRALDRVLDGGGLQPGMLYVCGGQTSMGKTLFLDTILRNVALAGHHAALLTLETRAKVVFSQIVYGLAGVDRHWYQATGAEVEPEDLSAVCDAIEQARTRLRTLHIDATAGLRPSQIRLRVARLASQVNLRVVGVDYLHKMQPDRQDKGMNRERELSEMVLSLGNTALEFNVALLLMAQLNRQNLGRETGGLRPSVGDFHGASDIEKFAFAIIGLHRHDYYVERGRLPEKPELKGILEAIVLKQQTGPAGVTARLKFDGALSQISDVQP